MWVAIFKQDSCRAAIEQKTFKTTPLGD